MQRSRARSGSRAPLLMGLVLMMLTAGCGRPRERLSADDDEIINGVISTRQTLVRISMYNQIDAANAAAGRGRNPTSLCSGRRIAKGVILTAAHCVYGFTMMDVSFPNIAAAGGAPRTYEGVVKGAISEGYTGDIMGARDIAVLLYDENPNLNLPPIPLGQPQWNAAGGRGRAYGRRQPNGEDGDVDEFFHSPTRFYTHAQMPLTVIASTTNPPPAVAGAPVSAPAMHGGDSGGPFAVRAAGPGRPLRTVAVNSAQDFECQDDGVPVQGRSTARRCRAVKNLKRTYAPAPAGWVDVPVGRGYWAGIDNVALAWLNGFVAQAAVNNGVWPAAYDLSTVAATWWTIENTNHCVRRQAGFLNQQDCGARPTVFDNKYPVCLDHNDQKLNFNAGDNPPIASDKLREYIPSLAGACDRGSESCTDGLEMRDTSCSTWCGALARLTNSLVFRAGCVPKRALRTCTGAGPTDYVAECRCEVVGAGPPRPDGGVITSLGMGSGSGVMDARLPIDARPLDARSPFDARPVDAGPPFDAGPPPPDARFDAGAPFDAGWPDASWPPDAGWPDASWPDAGGPPDGPPPSITDLSGWPSWAKNLPLTPGCPSPSLDATNDCWLRANHVGSVDTQIEPRYPPSSSSPPSFGSEPSDDEPGLDDGY